MTRTVSFAALAGLLTLVAVVQIHDAVAWGTGPWLGFSLAGHGRIVVRGRSEIPSELAALYDEHRLWVVAVDRGAGWEPIAAAADWPSYDVGSRSRAAIGRLRRALATTTPGSRVAVRLRTETGVIHEVSLPVRTLPPGTVFERAGLYIGLGLSVLVLGGLVLRARPAAPDAIAFAVFAAALGGQLLTTQVLGGYPSRFYWLSLVGCYATPAAAAALALTLAPTPWTRRHPWVACVPWIAAVAGAAVATVDGSVAVDTNPAISTLRVAAWVFFAGYLLAARLRAVEPVVRRRLEFYLVGLALTFVVPLLAYARPLAPGEAIPSWVLFPLAVFPVIVGYGVLKHRLFDIELVLRRSIALASVVVIAAVAYSALVAGASRFAAETAPAASLAITAAFAAAALALGVALWPGLQRLVDRGVNPSRFHYLDALRRTSEEIAEQDDEDEIAARLAEVATSEMQLAGAAVFLRSSRGYRLAARAGAIGCDEGLVLAEDAPLVSLAGLVGSEIHRDDFRSNPRLEALRDECLKVLDRLEVEYVVPIAARRGGLVGMLALGPPQPGRARLNSEEINVLRMILALAAGAIGGAIGRAQTSSAVTSSGRPVPQALAPGARVGHYVLGDPVGRGGMGTLFRAHDDNLGRDVALKFLNEDRQASDDMRERLRREARTLAALNHPGIMQIYALEEAAGHVFLAVELLDGDSLVGEIRAGGGLAPVAVVDVALAMARALEYALRHDVIHRDIKPANVMRTRAGEIKLMDFGLAQLASPAAETGLTGSGIVIGTPAYLAPELLAGRKATFKSDLYALGLTILALLSGRNIVREPGEDHRSLVAAEALHSRAVPPPLHEIVTGLLEVEPEARYPGYGELIADLERAREEL